MRLTFSIALTHALFTLAAILGFPAVAQAQTNTGTFASAYVIPVKGMIERGLVYVIRRGVSHAIEQGADVIIFDMDTPGGRLDAAQEIIKTIASPGIKTCTYVNPDAISAGAIIAMGTDVIYMAPGSRIGDAMPIMVSPLGGAQEMSEGMEEKSVSYVSSMIRSAAQSKGHDAELAEAMVRREIEYKAGDEIICPEGQLLTLTNVEAEQMVKDGRGERRLLSKGTVGSMEELLSELNLEGAEIVRFKISPAEEVARFIEMFSVLFLVGGLLGIYIEFKTPGFGIPGISGILLLIIWFWGHNVAGLAGMGEVVLLVVGIALLMLELFVTPGFGVLGVTGLVLIFVSLGMAMVENYPGMPWYKPPEVQIQRALTDMGLAIVVTTVLGVIIGRFLPKTSLFRNLMLATEETGERGYRASDTTDSLVGRQGTAVTALRPAGLGKFGQERLNVVSRGEFIEAGSPIVIAEAHGNRLVVETGEGMEKEDSVERYENRRDGES